jgi:hypothetical protein
MSGLHFGHYKAAADRDYISELHSSLTERAFAWGCSLPRWQHNFQVMLEKKPGVRHVEKLRAILLMEADFNCANKLYFGSRMMRNAARHSAIPPELYGSVRGRRADIMSLFRRALLDLARIRRLCMAILSADAAQCYN